MLQYAVLLGAVINFSGAVAYIRDTLLGRTKPNRVTFLMWSLAPFIATAAALSDGGRWEVLPVFMSGFCPFMIFAASFVNRQATWNLHWFDYACGGASFLALFLWAITRDPTIAIVLAIISDGLAALPTVRKAWSHPETETSLTYLAASLAASTSFLAISEWRFNEYAFPVYLVSLGLILFLFIHGRRATMRRARA